MKRITSLLAIILLASSSLLAQKKSAAVKPFIVQGNLRNFKADKLYLFYDGDNGNLSDTMNVDANGNFKLISYKVKKPGTAYLKKTDWFYTDLFVAPGYSLKINADCANGKEAPAENKAISGYGAAANRYLFIRDSVLQAGGKQLEWFTLHGKELAAYEHKMGRLRDSIELVAFGDRKNKDPYYKYFHKKVVLNNVFLTVDHITYQAAGDTITTWAEAADYINKNIDGHIADKLKDKTLFDDSYKNIKSLNIATAGKGEINNPVFGMLNSPEFLMSDAYRDFMVNGFYQTVMMLARKKDPHAYTNKTYFEFAAKVISTAYKGKIKQMALYKLLRESEQHTRSFEELNQHEKTFPPFIAQLDDKKRRDELTNLFTIQEARLKNVQIGRAAPAFSAEDKAGKAFDLKDFKGKVVLLDLWASWCAPCREMTPYLKKLQQKYDDSSPMAFVSIAVMDKSDAWKKAVDQDKPLGLQLFDVEGTVQNLYDANSIPKLILIDKKGNIVTFDAPISKTMAELKELLDAEIAK